MKLLLSYCLILVFLLFGLNAYGQDITTNPDINLMRKQLLDGMKNFSLESSSVEDFAKAIQNFRRQSEEYIDLKNRDCSGEFSTLTIKEGGLEKEQAKELSEEEIEACYSGLKNFEIQFTNQIFDMRKNYLSHLNKKQIASLEQTKLDVLADLEKKFKQSRSKPKSRRKKR